MVVQALVVEDVGRGLVGVEVVVVVHVVLVFGDVVVIDVVLEVEGQSCCCSPGRAPWGYVGTRRCLVVLRHAKGPCPDHRS